MIKILAVPALAVGVLLFAANTSVWAEGYRAQNAANTWTGFYVGAHAGHAWGAVDLQTDAGTVTATSYFTSVANIDSINQNGSGSLSPSTFVGGIQVGANLQRGNLVFGLETDFGAFNLKGSLGATNVPYPTFPAATYTMRAAMDTDWLFTARARVGWLPRTNLLIYTTGGLALTSLRVSNSFSDNGPESGVGGTSNSELKIGWTLGGGAEWALTKDWSFKAEYLYVDFGSSSASGSVTCGAAAAAACALFNVTPNAYSTSADLSAQIMRAGVNFKF